MNDMRSDPSCCVCGGYEYRIAYRGPIRDGAFGKLTESPVDILECVGCGLQKLEKFVMGQAEYASDEYRQKYNGTSEDIKLLVMHDPEQTNRLQLIGIDKLRGKIIVDYGCGHGSFLDAVSGVAKQTYGIEPFRSMWDSLDKRGHRVFETGSLALIQLTGQVDIVTCFGVIEHVEDPVKLIRDCYKLLAPGGALYLQTDNLRDILMLTEAKHFSRFFYRTAHNWYFLPENTERLVKSGGFDHIETKTTYGFDFSNFLHWHRDGKPTGLGKSTLFDAPFESFWRASVEAQGYGDLISLVARKHQSQAAK